MTLVEKLPRRGVSRGEMMKCAARFEDLMALEEMAVAGRIEECEDEADDGWVAPRTNPRRFRSA